VTLARGPLRLRLRCCDTGGWRSRVGLDVQVGLTQSSAVGQQPAQQSPFTLPHALDGHPEAVAPDGAVDDLPVAAGYQLVQLLVGQLRLDDEVLQIVDLPIVGDDILPLLIVEGRPGEGVSGVNSAK
jgi:hypothetical protein